VTIGKYPTRQEEGILAFTPKKRVISIWRGSGEKGAWKLGGNRVQGRGKGVGKISQHKKKGIGRGGEQEKVEKPKGDPGIHS